MATPTMWRSITQVGPLPVGIYVLVAATALTHLALGAVTTMMVATEGALVASMGGATALSIMAALFYCNFAGYVALVTALYLPALRRFQALTRRALMGYTALTVVAYFALAQGHFDMFGLADKLDEAVLIALLAIEGRRLVEE